MHSSLFGNERTCTSGEIIKLSVDIQPFTEITFTFPTIKNTSKNFPKFKSIVKQLKS